MSKPVAETASETWWQFQQMLYTSVFPPGNIQSRALADHMCVAADPEEIDSLGLTFMAGLPGIGEPVSMALCEDGDDVAVTVNNLREYVQAYADCILRTSVEKQVCSLAFTLLGPFAQGGHATSENAGSGYMHADAASFTTLPMYSQYKLPHGHLEQSLQ